MCQVRWNIKKQRNKYKKFKNSNVKQAENLRPWPPANNQPFAIMCESKRGENYFEQCCFFTDDANLWLIDAQSVSDNFIMKSQRIQF